MDNWKKRGLVNLDFLIFFEGYLFVDLLFCEFLENFIILFCCMLVDVNYNGKY